MKKSFALLAALLFLGVLTLAADNFKSQSGGLPALEERVHALEWQAAKLVEQVGNIENYVHQIRAAIGGLKGDVINLQAAIVDIRADLGTLRDEVEKLTNGNGDNVLFSQHDNVTAFSPISGLGVQAGIVTGKVTGTSIVNFQFAATSATTFSFNNKVVITDLDGDQLSIRNQGTGQFIQPIDPAVFGFGGRLAGTYEVIGGTGKFSSWIGMSYAYRAVMSNPVGGGLGTVNAQILSNAS